MENITSKMLYMNLGDRFRNFAIELICNSMLAHEISYKIRSQVLFFLCKSYIFLTIGNRDSMFFSKGWFWTGMASLYTRSNNTGIIVFNKQILRLDFVRYVSDYHIS